MGFKVEVINVTRDFSQGTYGNRIPLNDPDILASYQKWNDVLAAVKIEESNSCLKFSAIEAGGAQPQVDTVYCNRDWTQTLRDMRKAAPDTTIRPLWRGPNGFMLEPAHPEELQWLLSQLVVDVARDKESANPELLRIKVFDSQGTIAEVEPTVKMVAALREKGYKIGVEVAIPYTNGKDLHPNPFTDQYYVDKIVAAAKLAEEYGIPSDVFRVSLKDMIGGLDADSAKRLTGKFIEALKKEGLQTKLGLHLHDTGLAVEAYAAAIAECKEKDWPIAVDTVEGNDTGFASTLALDAHLKEKYGIDLGLSEEQVSALTQMAELTDNAAKRYNVRRTEGNLPGEALRHYKIPGGGVASFETAVASMGLAASLGISEADAVNVAGTSFNTVSKLMGEPHAVTPGFQNKQKAALHFLKNMLEQKALQPGMSLEEIYARIKEPAETVDTLSFLEKMQGTGSITPEMPLQTAIEEIQKHRATLTDEESPEQNEERIQATLALAFLDKMQCKEPPLLTSGMTLAASTEAMQQSLGKKVNDWFLKNIEREPAVVAFLKREGLPAPVHPLIRAAIPPRKGLLTDGVESKLPAYQQVVRELQEDGWLPEGEERFNSAVSWAIISGNPEQFRQYVMKHEWLREPDPSKYTSKEEYTRDLKKFQKGISANPDAADKIRKDLLTGKIHEDVAHARITQLLEEERSAISRTVKGYIEDNKARLTHVMQEASKASEAGVKKALEKSIEAFYTSQQDIIREHMDATGAPFLYSEEERTDSALELLTNTLLEPYRTQEEFARNVREVVNSTKEDIRATQVKVDMPGQVVKLYVELPEGQSIVVKKGEPLYTISAAKMEHTVRAPKDLTITHILCQEGDMLTQGQVVMECGTLEEKQDLSQEKEQEKKPSLRRKAPVAAEMDEVEKEPEEDKTIPLLEMPEPTEAQKRGHYIPAWTQGEGAGNGKEEWLHVVGNRAGCAAKIAGDLTQAGHDVVVLYTEKDKTTPVVKHAPKGKAVRIGDYTNQEEMIETLRTLAKANPGKKILFHPGWGFLSEKSDFVEKVEKLREEEGYDVVFAGPPSKAMEAFGGKDAFRLEAENVAKECNPPFFIPDLIASEDLNQFIASGYSEEHPLYETMSKIYGQVMDMGGDVMLKAVDGGGGRGIEGFNKGDFKSFVELYAKNTAYAEKQFSNGKMLIEHRIRNAQHIEAQIIATNGQGLVIGYRNCSVQDPKQQKMVETNIVKGDFEEEIWEKIHRNSQAMAGALAEKGYRGPATLEMMVNHETGEVGFLEINTRIQVEHPVTEEDIYQKTGKRVSIPALTAHLVVNNGTETPQEILHNVCGLKPQESESVALPSDERVAHFRIVSRNVSLAEGTITPCFFRHDLPPELLARIAAENNVSIIWGTLGGDYDPQIGAVYGNAADVLKASQQFQKAFQVLQVCDRSPDTTTLAAVQELYPLFMFPSGQVNQAFFTSTFKQMLEAITSGDIAMQATANTFTFPSEKAIREGALAECFAAVSGTGKTAEGEKEAPSSPTWVSRTGKEKNVTETPTSFVERFATNGDTPGKKNQEKQAMGV